MAAFHVDPPRIAGALSGANKELRAGSYSAANREVLVDVGEFLEGAESIKSLVVGTFGERPVYLRDVADVSDGPEGRDLCSSAPARQGRQAKLAARRRVSFPR
jgi:multidrug efflux pump subunit AcrB